MGRIGETMEELKQKLVEFFVEMLDYRQYFKKKYYEDTFKKCYEDHRELLASIIETCEKAEDKDAVIEELSGAIPDYAHGQINAKKRKSAREGLMIDYNMAMVTFVVPILGYSENESSSAMIDRMIEKWNQDPVTMKISRSDFESLKGGFKSRFCYITTAVCQSQGKTDNCYELNLLRDFRDNCLLKSEEGRALVEEYYDVAPTIVKRIDRQAHAGEIYGRIYDTYLSGCIRAIEADKPEECREIYRAMVEELEETYLYS